MSTSPFFDVGQQRLELGTIERRAGPPGIVVALGELGPALVVLARDVGRTDRPLHFQGIDFLLKTHLDALARVDGAALLLAGVLGIHGASPSRPCVFS